jgi:hypothetical protein
VRVATTIAALAGAAVSSGVASATTIEECSYGQSYGLTKSYEEHRDLGNGHISYAVRFVDTGSGWVIVSSCRSGLTLEIDYSGSGRRSVQAFVTRAAEASQGITLAAIQKHFLGLGVETGISTVKVEHCACAALYPELKGDKAEWAVPGHPGHP